MEKRAKRFNAIRLQLVNQTLVVSNPFFVRLARALWENTRPRNREAIRFSAEPLQQLHIFFVAMVLVVGDVAGLIFVHLAGNMRKRVPDGGSSAILLGRAFHLIRGGGTAPKKTVGKLIIVLAGITARLCVARARLCVGGEYR